MAATGRRGAAPVGGSDGETGGNWRWVFWLTAGSLALAALAGPLFGLPTFGFVGRREWLTAVGQPWNPVATFTRYILTIRPWSPLEVYYYPLAFLDLLAAAWRALFLGILAVLPPGLVVWAPWVWGFYIALMLTGLWVGTAPVRATARATARRRETIRPWTGPLTGRPSNCGRRAGMRRLAPADPLLAGYVFDATPRGSPVPEGAGSLPAYPLDEVLATARAGSWWPDRPPGPRAASSTSRTRSWF